jgi:hypothetical protein
MCETDSRHQTDITRSPRRRCLGATPEGFFSLGVFLALSSVSFFETTFPCEIARDLRLYPVAGMTRGALLCVSHDWPDVA